MRCEPNPTGGSTAPAIEGLAITEPSSLDLFLEPLRSLLADHEVTEICINRPGEAYVERQSGWSQPSCGMPASCAMPRTTSSQPEAESVD